MDPKPERLFTFASGGWVIVLVLAVCTALLVWALAPVVLRISNRPPGDGKTIESFAFDLSSLAVPRDLVVPGMLHREMVPVMTDPTHSAPDADADAENRWRSMQRHNDPKYGKYMVSNDLVIGVSLNGESRAYPLHLMYVHDIVNDTLGGVPIAVTHNWHCGASMVLDRRVGDGAESRVAEFGISGLMYNSNYLMYDRREPLAKPTDNTQASGPGGESLFSQLLARPISGQAVQRRESLAIVPCELVTWADWSHRHPETTVVDRDLSMAQRYKDAAPTQYVRSSELAHPVSPLAESPPAGPLDLKTPVLAVVAPEGRRVYPVPYVLHLAQPVSPGTDVVEWTDAHGPGDTPLRFIGDRKAGTLRVERLASATEQEGPLAINCYWFAWHAMYPNDEIVSAVAGAGESHQQVPGN